MKKILSLALALALTMTCLVFTACVPKNPEKAVEKLEKANYNVVLRDDVISLTAEEVTYRLERGSIEAIINAENNGSVVVIYYCSDKTAAKALEERLDDLSDNDDDDSIEVKRSGKIVYAGNEQGIKAID